MVAACWTNKPATDSPKTRLIARPPFNFLGEKTHGSGSSLVIFFLLCLKVASDQGPCRKDFASIGDEAKTREVQLFSEIRRPSKIGEQTPGGARGGPRVGRGV